MKEKDDLNNKVKASFQQQSAKAPDMLWKSIADNLPEASGRQEPLLDQKIRTSFKQAPAKAPASVWQAVNQQLNIDRTWKGIERSLDNRPAGYWHYLAYAAGILLLALFWLWPANDNTESRQVTLKPTQTINEPQADQPGRAGQSPEADSLRSQQAGLSLSRTSDQTPPSSSTAITAQGNRQAVHSTSLPENNAVQSASKAHYMPPTNIGTFKQTQENNSLVLSRQVQPNTPALASAPTPSHFAGLPELHSRSYMMLPEAKAMLAIAPEQESLTEEKHANESRRAISVGPVLSYNNSWLINNETRNSFREGSLISSQLSYQKNLGIAVYIPSGRHFTWIADLQFVGKDKQNYSLFEGGEYKRKELALSYYKAGLQLQYHIPRIAFVSGLTLKAGLFGGLLDHTEGDMQPDHSQYRKFNAGFRLGLGQEKQLGNVIIGYGLATEKGLLNVYKGSGSIPARFNKTHTFNLGPYVNFRYLFLSKE